MDNLRSANANAPIRIRIQCNVDFKGTTIETRSPLPKIESLFPRELARGPCAKPQNRAADSGSGERRSSWSFAPGFAPVQKVDCMRLSERLAGGTSFWPIKGMQWSP